MTVAAIDTVLILEDHLGAQKWLSQAIYTAFGNHVLIQLADTLQSAVQQLHKNTFNLFIVDLHLPDGPGIEALRLAKSRYPDMPCVVATIYSDEDHLFPALQAGTDGYLLKDDSKQAIAEMLCAMQKGKPPLSADIAQRLLHHFQQPRNNPVATETPALTVREKETLQYLVKGFSVRECAQYMEISPHTVSGYVKDIYKKLQVSTRAEVTAEANRLGLFH